MKRKICYAFLCICFLFNTASQAVYLTIPTWAEDSLVETSSGNLGENFLELNCESSILISQDTGEVLYEHNSHEQLRPASVTKVMSILLIMEEIDSGRLSYQDKITCSEHASSMGGSQIWLDPTEELTVDEMLKAICVVSANDCTVAMAEHIAGSEELFVDRMNERAKELGMNDTTFKNCHGIDEDGHVTSAYDISLMSRELLMNHLRNYEGATGLKTGSTSLALFNLSASATRDDLSLIAVVMRAPTTKDRFSCAKKLLDYGFSNYQYKKFANKDDEVMRVPVSKGIEAEVSVKYAETSGKIMEKKDNANVEQEIIINDNISAPISKNQVLGKANFKVDGETISSVDLIANSNVEKITIFTMTNRVIRKWFYLFRM